MATIKLDSKTCKEYEAVRGWSLRRTVAAEAEKARASGRDICIYCQADTTDQRVGFDCCNCGGN